MDDILKRAIAGYFRYGDSATTNQPSTADSGVVEHEEKQYAVLRNVNGVLAVYRVRTDGVLKRLKRWPAAIEQL
ncbi:hypothetical protein J5J83_17945 [Azoarcus sp. L1K30]|uniref:hypothetical protein n=1 Tax=Azoarcus sp. L1K30 TaxID=2820277 RepID=UPI001B8355B7|nr:hypothetical protein [Azoarcus sp. L1K30]MBR0568008.1 hypothetical protein [Azoarcus sp. L1K30]